MNRLAFDQFVYLQNKKREQKKVSFFVIVIVIDSDQIRICTAIVCWYSCLAGFRQDSSWRQKVLNV